MADLAIPVPYVCRVQAESVDPRDTSWDCAQPVYRVYFWRRSMPPPDSPVQGPGWYSDEYRLVDATDVHEVLAWGDERLEEGDRYVLYIEQSNAGRLGLVRLAGNDSGDYWKP